MKNDEVIKFFDRYSFYTDDKIQRDIKNNRMGAFLLELVDSEGNPINNAKVHINQVSHDFKFGCSLFLLDELETEEKNQKYREYFKKCFNYSVVPLYWNTLEPTPGNYRFAKGCEKIYRRPPIDLITEFCKENKIKMKGHCLMYNSFNPDWMPEDHRELKIAVDKRLKAISEHCGNDFDDVDVINELFGLYRCTHGDVGSGTRRYPISDEKDHVNWCFNEAKKYFPFSKLHWNEGCFEIFGGAYSGEKSYYYMMLEKYLNQGVPIEAIGMQFHAFGQRGTFEKQIYNPVRLMDIFDKYSEFGLPIHLSEVSIPSYSNGEEDEYIQAELVKRMVSLWFAQKNIEAVVWWNLVDGTAYPPENVYHAGLLRNDMTPKPAYNELCKLINEVWHTEFDTECINENVISFNGFYGDYEVTVEKDGIKTKHTVSLNKDNTGYHHDFKEYGLRKIKIKNN